MSRSHEDALTIEVGDQLVLKDGSVVVVDENPRDGVWLFCSYLSSPDESLAGQRDQPVYHEHVVSFNTAP